MSRKLAISPDTSYLLGLYRCSARNGPAISITTRTHEILERFIRIAMSSLEVEPNKLLLSEEEGSSTVTFYNSRAKRMLEDALNRRERIFKYKNEYSANYFAALMDCNGGVDGKGVFLQGLDAVDWIVLERIGFHSTSSGRKTHFINGKAFLEFISAFSVTVGKRVKHRPRPVE